MLKWIVAFLFVIGTANSLAAKGLVDINSCTLEQLEALPGIGLSQAANILANRPYGTVTDLVDRDVISKARFAKIRHAITTARSPAEEQLPAVAEATLDLNSATAAELQSLPGVNENRAAAIVAARPYERVTELVARDVMPKSAFDRIKSRIVVSDKERETMSSGDEEATASGKIDLNSATAEQLAALPGVDAARASAIIAARPYDRISQLVGKEVIPKAAFDQIREGIMVSGQGSASDREWAPKGSPSKATVVIDLNGATADELVQLPGIGRTRAAAIIAARPFASIDQVVSKGIVPQATFDLVKEHIIVSGSLKSIDQQTTASVKPTGPNVIDLNSATVDQLTAIPGIGPTRAAEIVARRPYASIEDVVSKAVLPKVTFDLVKDRLTVAAPAVTSAEKHAATAVPRE
jgi:DNA uptake protein ComE-like DNA-binding protein